MRKSFPKTAPRQALTLLGLALAAALARRARSEWRRWCMGRSCARTQSDPRPHHRLIAALVHGSHCDSQFAQTPAGHRLIADDSGLPSSVIRLRTRHAKLALPPGHLHSGHDHRRR